MRISGGLLSQVNIHLEMPLITDEWFSHEGLREASITGQKWAAQGLRYTATRVAGSSLLTNAGVRSKRGHGPPQGRRRNHARRVSGRIGALRTSLSVGSLHRGLGNGEALYETGIRCCQAQLLNF